MHESAVERHLDHDAARASPAKSDLSEWFRKFASSIAWKMGSHWAFIIALGTVVAWALTGPIFHFSEVWQLVINTATTIITFLMVFVIQSTQNRDAKAFHLKLDELIRASKARNVFADLEDASETELREYAREFEALRQRAQQKRARKKVISRG
ncbi:MAG TPA: low affinity iron permease family protein [Polyangiaceae bacterium]|nr:low affinity iron permease family protein [Polyangiaceae bacterium]